MTNYASRYIDLKIRAFFIITRTTHLHARFCILLTRGNHLNNSIISLRGDVYAHKTSLTPPLLIELPVLIQES